MIDDDVMAVVDRQRITFHLILVTHTETKETDDDIACLDHHGVAGYADAVTRCCLTGDGYVTALDLQLLTEVDRSRHIEHDRTCAVHLQRLAQRTDDGLAGGFVLLVGEGRDVHNYATASTGGVFTAAVSTRKSNHRRSRLRLRPRLISTASREAEREAEQQDGCFNRGSHSTVCH